MAGSARSKAIVTLMSVRVAGNPDYIPAHTAPGKDKPTSQRALFRVFHNDGGDKANVFSCTAWGKLADAVARGCGAGKEISINGELKSYPAKVWQDLGNGNRQPQRNADGSFVMTTKVGIKVDSIIFGSDSNTLAVDEIGKGLRPPLYNVIGSQDEMTWKNMCKQKNAEQYVPNSLKFGNAEVKLPAGAAPITAPQTGTGYAQPQAGSYPPAAPAYGAPQQGGFQPPPPATQMTPTFMHSSTFPAGQTDETMIAAGWTYETMATAGFGSVINTNPTPPPAPQAPFAPPVPPAPQAPTGYQPPVAGTVAPGGYQPPTAPAMTPPTMAPAMTPPAGQEMKY